MLNDSISHCEQRINSLKRKIRNQKTTMAYSSSTQQQLQLMSLERSLREEQTKLDRLRRRFK